MPEYLQDDGRSGNSRCESAFVTRQAHTWMATALPAKPGSRNVALPIATTSTTLRGAARRGQWTSSELPSLAVPRFPRNRMIESSAKRGS
jgi:hypothetical protein